MIDDLPWPELGNVSRGATRGNQGQKGALGSPDREGRSVLQLRVQPGVLAVRLNPQATNWYRTLDGEVNRALKLTKTYWRKARRRQDYNARADQDHMELHEWLQQLKDKTMSYLEVLMQKGDITGPPYVMPDDVELVFLRKFIERHNAGIPHNPRLRTAITEKHSETREASVDSMASETSVYGYAAVPDTYDQPRQTKDTHVSKISAGTRVSISPPAHGGDSVVYEADASKQALANARNALLKAQKETQVAFMRYNSCLEAERQARQEVNNAEKRRDDMMTVLLSHTKSSDETQSRKSSVSADGHSSPRIYHSDGDHRSDPLYQKRPTHAVQDYRRTPESVRSSRQLTKVRDWSEADRHAIYSDGNEDVMKSHRKHSRSWDRESTHAQDNTYPCEETEMLPPRKRVHHFVGGYNIPSSAALQAQQSAALPS